VDAAVAGPTQRFDLLVSPSFFPFFLSILISGFFGVVDGDPSSGPDSESPHDSALQKARKQTRMTGLSPTAAQALRDQLRLARYLLLSFFYSLFLFLFPDPLLIFLFSLRQRRESRRNNPTIAEERDSDESDDDVFEQEYESGDDDYTFFRKYYAAKALKEKERRHEQIRATGLFGGFLFFSFSSLDFRRIHSVCVFSPLCLVLSLQIPIATRAPSLFAAARASM
jgi:hypothetical protein